MFDNRARVLSAMMLVLTVFLSAPLCAGSIHLRRDTTKTFFTRRDLTYLAGGVAVTALTGVFDERVTNWVGQPAVIGSPSRQRLVKHLTDWSGETTLTWA